MLNVMLGGFATIWPLAAQGQIAMADPRGSGPIVSAAQWLQGTLLGTVATVVPVIAVACVGLLMLTGRINWRHGAVVIIGCFILFGAVSIVVGIRSAAVLQADAVEPFDRTPLFTAMTRPQMFAGVTYNYFVINSVIAAELFLVFRSIWMLSIALVVHLAGVLICLREHRAVDLWITRISRCPRIPNHRIWRCNSYRP